MASADDIDEFAQWKIGTDRYEVFVYNTLQTHQGEHGTVGMMRYEFALACQPHGIDAVGFEDADGKNGYYTHDDERYEEGIAARDLGYKEDSRKGCVHHARHHACHAQQGKVFFWNVYAHLVDVPKARKEESTESTDKQ